MGGEEEFAIQPTDFVPITVVPSPAKTGAERMRDYRSRKRLQQIYEIKNNNFSSDFDATIPVLRLARTSLERFIPPPQVPRLAKTAAERMRAYRARKRLQQTHENKNKKHAKTPAERARAYRQRQREMRFGETVKKRPASGAERTRKYRERKKAELLECSQYLREKLATSVNAWDGILIVPDIVPATDVHNEPAVSCHILCSDMAVQQEASVEKRRMIRFLMESERFSDSNDTVEECAAECDGIPGAQNAQPVVNIKYELAAVCCSPDNDTTTTEPSLNVVSDDITPIPAIKCEQLDLCDNGYCSSTPEKCTITGVELIDAQVELNLKRTVGLECEPRPLCRIDGGCSTEECAVLDATNEPSSTNFELESSLTTAKPTPVYRESECAPVTAENVEKNVIGERRIFDQTLFISVKNPVDSSFCDKPYGSVCDLCNRLCSDKSPLTGKHMLRFKFPIKNREHVSVCTGCRKTLNGNRISSKSQSYGNDDALTLFFCNSLWQM